METLDWARLQFAITTLFHFIFVPMSIGLGLWIAICQTRYYRSKDEVWLRATRFWGKFFLISMAIGVVTGIVQEFQFGMNWSLYSRFVGDIFGPPLAMEALIAFFMESTFIGLWIFGWDKLPPKLHLMTIWLVAIGTTVSAIFILIANSFMQHPVGYTYNPVLHRLELKSIWDVLFNNTALYAIPHTVLGAFTTGAMLVIAISALLLLRGSKNQVLVRSLKAALPYAFVLVLVTALIGDSFGRLLVHQQPIKMAAAGRIFNSGSGVGFSIIPGISIPNLESFFMTLSFNGHLKGIHEIEQTMVAQYGPGKYAPIINIVYWAFRFMLYAGTLLIIITLIGTIIRKKATDTRWFLKLCLGGFFLPIMANWGGWVVAEVGRQPWVVFGIQKTANANSPNVSTTNLVITLFGYLIIYGTLIAVGAWLMAREINHGPQPDPGSGETEEASPAQPDSMILAY